MILVVEDDLNIRRLFSVNLTARGHEVIEAGSGVGVLEIIQQQTPSLMLLDIRLPEMNGWELLNQLEEQHVPDFPVIVVTASIYPAEEKKREFPRIHDILFKPVNIEKLISVVEETLSSH